MKMKGAGTANKRPGLSWQKCLLWGAIMWVVLNFYLAEKLSRLADSPSPVAVEISNTETKMVHPQADKTDKLPTKMVHPQADKTGHKLPPSTKCPSRGKHYCFDRKLAEDSLSVHGRDAIFQPLRAYVEKKLNDTAPGTIDKGNLDEKKPKVQVGRPGKFYVPLPLRDGSPEDVSLKTQICSEFA